VVSVLAEEGLVELADERILDDHLDQEGRRPGWAARILPNGLLVLRYRQLHATPLPDHQLPEYQASAGIELTGGEVEVLRRFVTLGPLLPGARTLTLAQALAQAQPVPNSNRWVVPNGPGYLEAIESVFRLEMLTGSSDSRSYHRLWREHRTHLDPRVRLTIDVPD
jgi:hypothetical protein